jgi:hypothetical protein
MDRLRHALWPVALAIGVAAEWIGRPELVGLDAVTGFVLVGLGLGLWPRTAGRLMTAAGCAWFLGSVWAPALYLHRGPLAHLLLVYPAGRLVPSSTLERSGVVGAYAYAAAYPVAGNDYATAAFALGLVALAVRRYVAAGGTERRARLSAVVGAAVFAAVLVVAAATRVTGAGADRAVLWVYDLVVGAVAVALFADLLWGRWTQAAVTGLVVDLGDPAAAGTLRDRLARTLGDPRLVVGYWVAEQDRYVDEAGRPVALPDPDAASAVTVTPVDDDGRRVAILVHDPSLSSDPALVSAVASATRLVVSNATLQAEVRARVAEVAASRRRIVEAAADQRRRLEREFRQGAEPRLARVAELVSDIDPELGRQLAATRGTLRELARGIHPATLTDDGLAAAVSELTAASPIPTEVVAAGERFPPAIEAVAYFVCSEALANAAKHAAASRVAIRIAKSDGRLIVVVEDDGVGCADPAAGSGLRGLADRVEALGGRLAVDSPRGGGTRIVGELPL